MTRLEGSGYSRLAQMFGPSKRQPITITTADIKTFSEDDSGYDISIRVDGDSIDTPTEAITVIDELLTHTRRMRVVGGTWQSYEIESPLKVGDRVIVAIENDGQLIYVLAKAAL